MIADMSIHYTYEIFSVRSQFAPIPLPLPPKNT
jgi:hypothetical protein